MDVTPGNFHLYGVSLTDEKGIVRVIVLSAIDEKDVLDCIPREFGEVSDLKITPIDRRIGYITLVYQK